MEEVNYAGGLGDAMCVVSVYTATHLSHLYTHIRRKLARPELLFYMFHLQIDALNVILANGYRKRVTYGVRRRELSV